MKLLLIIGLLAFLGVAPFVALRKPWAVRAWGQIKLVVVVYVLVVLLAGVLRLVFQWDDFYG